MLNTNGHKKYTAGGNIEAEKLLAQTLREIGECLSGSGLSVYLGGSYGRGDGGVRQDTENGLLYNDLDFFVFSRQKVQGAEKLLHDIAKKYESQLKVDVDFSRVMSIKDIKRNSRRLMMQELKRGYRHICGEDLLEQYLPKYPAETLPFSEACRLWLNRGMGLLLAKEQIDKNTVNTDFVLRNINKAVLGSIDAYLIARNEYLWSLNERAEFIQKSDLPQDWKQLYQTAVEFKSSPHRQITVSVNDLWEQVKNLYLATVQLACQTENGENTEQAVFKKCRQKKELSVINYIKFCIKSHKIHIFSKMLFMDPAAVVLCKSFNVLSGSHDFTIDGKLLKYWQIFN